MNLANIAIVSVLVLGSVAVGCKNKDDDNADDTTTLGSSEQQLVEDDSEASDTDDDLEAAVDEPLSGATAEDPGTPADGATDDELLEKVRTNAGRFFKAGCLKSTRDGMKIKHEFDKCTGPYGLKDFNGTITSTFVREANKLTVTHEASGFTANGASITGQRVVVYTRAGTLVTKTRNGTWTGMTGKGKPVSHEASFVTTWDAAAKCITRDGSAETTIGGRSFKRVIDGFKRCGIGRGGCPDSGKITLERTKGGDNLTLSIEFLGGIRYRVTKPNGKQVERVLICNPRAS